MPEIGDIKRADELGKKGRGKYIRVVCPKCSGERWTRFAYRDRACSSCSASAAGQQMRGDKHPKWKGGRTGREGSYINIKLQPDDFFFSMADKNHYIREHRLIMAKYLGRSLLSWEIVHHKNGIKDDNRIENLVLIKGQADHIGFCRLQKENKKLNLQISNLQGRVTLLEAEMVLITAREAINADY